MHLVSYLAVLLSAVASVHAGCANNPTYSNNCEQYWKQYCTGKSEHWSFMKEHCKKTCGLCSECQNVPKHSSNCEEYWKQHCTEKSTHWGFMQENCKKTCGLCKVKTTPTPTKKPVGRKANSCGKRGGVQGRVIGGVEAEPHSWPWSVALLRFGGYFCGGSLINEQWVLTAAHCIYGKEHQVQYMQAVLGAHNRKVSEKSRQKIEAEKIKIHQGYSQSTLDNDIALIKLKKKVVLNTDAFGNPDKVGLVCLPKQGEAANTTDLCYITGWGKTTSGGSSSNILMEAEMPTVTNEKCKIQNSGTVAITKNMLCAGKEPGTKMSGCHGDSGGPFVCTKDGRKWTLTGAVSWGSSRCDRSEKYTVFARVSEYRDWIDREIGRTN